MNTDLCKLCNSEEQVDSHILPKFIFRWLKKTGTGRLRSTENINVPREDGIKKKFLCETCEKKFSKTETYFANRVFYPLINENMEVFEYDNRLQYFIISLFWRTLKDSLYKDVEGTKWCNTLLIAEKEWKNYLLNDEQLLNFNEIQCIAGVDIIEGKQSNDFVMYMSRMTDAGIPISEDLCFIYVKIPRFIFILPIAGFNLDCFKNSAIEINGTFNISRAFIKEPIIGNHLLGRAKLFEELKRGMSVKQKDSMENLTLEKSENWKINDLGIVHNYSNKK